MSTYTDQEQKQAVRDRYARAATEKSGCCDPGCCGDTSAATADEIGQTIGYSETELEGLPEDANLGLGCGNPTALASLTAGQTVLDLGSGAGIDCFLAAKQVGPSGKVIGVDMTAEMIDRARANAESGSFDATEICRRTPMGRFGIEDEPAEGLCFLLDPTRAGFVTGHVLEVSGGWTAYGFV